MKLSYTEELRNFPDSKVYNLHFIIPEKILEKILPHTKERRLMLSVEAGEAIHVGVMPHKEYHYILINKDFAKKNKLELGSKYKIEIEPDLSQYGMELPRELEEFLVQDEMFAQYFEALTPGKKRNLIYIVAKVKNSDKRIEKSWVITEHLKKMHGKVDFKILMSDLKKGLSN